MSHPAGGIGFERVVGALEKAGMIVAGACVAAIMLIVCWDAGGRYLLHRPLSWSFDFVSNYLLVIAAWFALAGTFQRGDHISINLLHARLSRRTRAVVDIVTGVLAIALFTAIGWASATHAQDAWANKEFYPGAVMWPAWLSYAPIPVGAALLVLRLAHHVVTLALRGEDPFVDAESAEAVE